MDSIKEMYKEFSLNDEKLYSLSKECEEELKYEFEKINDICEFNQLKVLNAFNKNKISEQHFYPSTGYGYDDVGRDTLDKVFADVFGAEDGLVRHSIVNGTHAISSCLYGVLRPGDTLVCVTGKPYDTLEQVIGIRENNNGSLKDFGVSYKEVSLKDGKVDYDGIKKAIDKSVKAVEIQRSKGYAWRESINIDEIEKIIKTVKSINKDIVCIVDNCYGEFVEKREPPEVGADLTVGSLIKNPGGGLARTGAYIVGTKKAVELVSYRVTCPGIGKECGASLGENRFMYQGFFMAPHTVMQALKSALFLSCICKKTGYETMPAIADKRTDIIQAVKLESREKLIAFCKGIQSGSPVDSFVTPTPSDMPGYESQVIMAAGAFTQGSSIEISADGPLREPYVVYFQGGLTYESAKIAVLKAIDNISKI